jgi:hypothetical protein
MGQLLFEFWICVAPIPGRGYKQWNEQSCGISEKSHRPKNRAGNLLVVRVRAFGVAAFLRWVTQGDGIFADGGQD